MSNQNFSQINTGQNQKLNFTFINGVQLESKVKSPIPKLSNLQLSLGKKSHLVINLFFTKKMNFNILSNQNEAESKLEINIYAQLSDFENGEMKSIIKMTQEAKKTSCFLNFFLNVSQNCKAQIEIESIINQKAQNSKAIQKVYYFQDYNSQVTIFPRQILNCPSSHTSHGVAKIKLSNNEMDYLKSRGIRNYKKILGEGILEKVLNKIDIIENACKIRENLELDIIN